MCTTAMSITLENCGFLIDGITLPLVNISFEVSCAADLATPPSLAPVYRPRSGHLPAFTNKAFSIREVLKEGKRTTRDGNNEPTGHRQCRV